MLIILDVIDRIVTLVELCRNVALALPITRSGLLLPPERELRLVLFPPMTWLDVRDCGCFAEWLTPVLPVGISACFGMLARRPAFMLARRQESLSVRTVPPDAAARVSLA